MRNFVLSSGYVSFKFKDGVIVGCDTQGSYGSLAKYSDIRRLIKLGSHTIACFAGEVSDTQALIQTLKRLIEEDKQEITPSGFHKIVQRILYSARNKMEPFNTSVVIGGIQSNSPVADSKGRVLGGINHLGNPHFSDSVSTGLASSMALSFIRSFNLEALGREEAVKVVEEALRIMCYRSTRSSNKVQIGIVDANGVSISEPYKLQTNWVVGLQQGEEVIV